MSCCFGSSSPPSGSDNSKDLLKKIKVLEEKLGKTEKKLREAERQRDAAQQDSHAFVAGVLFLVLDWYADQAVHAP